MLLNCLEVGKRKKMSREIIKDLDWKDKLLNFFTFNKNHTIKGYCSHCHSPVFNLETEFARNGYCVYCHELVLSQTQKIIIQNLKNRLKR
jgi:hypothetical protein